MGSHRKPRAGILDSPAARRGAVGVGAMALASASLLTQSAHADDDDTPAIEEQRDRAETARERALEVREQVDALYQEAGSATQRYNAAREATDEQQRVADGMMTEAAEATERLNEARRTLGSFAAAQYRTGGGALSDTAALLLAPDPQSLFAANHALDRAANAQEQAVADYTDHQREAAAQRAEATEALGELEASEADLDEQKQAVQDRLAEARALLDQLSAEEQAELDELERLEREEAERRAEQARIEREERERQEREAAEQAAAEAAAQEQAEQEQAEQEATPPPADTGDSYSSQAAAAIAFAEAQLGKPYVWGATGPDSYDCSGLTQAAWASAGVDIPRVTWDQVNIGTTVSASEAQPGDLVFFYDDISHVGLYIGDGMMIHAPKPGDIIKYEAVDVMPVYSYVRPA